MESLEKRIMRLELRLQTAESAAMLALRLIVDDLSLRVSRGELKSASALRQLRFAARQVGEGAPHLQLAVNEIVTAYISKWAHKDDESDQAN